MKEIFFPKIEGYSKNKKVFVLGKFESIHLAHRKLLEIAKEIANKNNYELGIMIFPEREKGNFYSLEERKKFLKEYNPKYLMIFSPSTKNFSYSKNDFDNWLKKINVVNLVVGYDFAYGKNKEGNTKSLSIEFDTKIVEKENIGSFVISSNNLKKAIENSDFVLYKEMIGHYFFYNGIVLKGKGMGSKLSMPTINVLYPKYKIDLPYGIYYSYVIYNGRRYESLTSVSNNPTFNEKETAYETYIYNFSEYIYGENVYVEIIEKFRDPIKFDTIDLLIKQLKKDKNEGKRYFQQKKG